MAAPPGNSPSLEDAHRGGEESGQAGPAQTNQDEAIIEADSEEVSDSGYDTNSESDQTSITSSTYTFIHEHGHRYHRKGEALLPNDETEQDRLDLQHHIFKMLLEGELTSTPLQNEALNILDVGTGTGIWAIEMGDKYASATITGVDESPIQPIWVPPNVQFEIDDVTKPWFHPADSFDLVHIRTMAGCIADWPTLLRDAFRVVKPGGRIEVTDIVWHFDCQDGTLHPESSATRWANTFHLLAQTHFHVDFAPSPKMPGWLADAGFIVEEPTIKLVPVGPWPKNRKLKDIGGYFLSQMLEGGMENYSIGLFTKAGWDPVEVHAMLGKVRREIQNPGIHAFTRAWFVKGTKPKEELNAKG